MSSEIIWTLVAVAAVLAALLLKKVFQPSGLVIQYDPNSYFEVRRLFFAAGVLAVLGFILVLSIAIYATATPPVDKQVYAAKEIFDTVVKVVPPIITLVLGYYFGQQSATKAPDKIAPTTK